MSRYQKYYRKRQAEVTQEAIEYQFQLLSGEVPDDSWAWEQEQREKFLRLGKRFGLMQEFRENLIV